jgi:prepilin-type N-terminal cleavage/methylation domain-containing protein
MADAMRNSSQSPRGGFTLVELLVVIGIIGLIIALILVAAADGVRRAEERATQALIVKLEAALNDRLDALLNTQAPINQTHRYLAAIGAIVGSNSANSYDRRAATIAQFDYLRAELPDVFFLNSQTTDNGSPAAQSYPLNFAAAPYPPGTNAATNFVLPLGNTYVGLPLDVQGNPVPNAFSNYTPPPISGMFGASFSAAGGLYKQLGYAPQGYDGVDNDGQNGIDDIGESGTTLAAVLQKLSNHTHKTARAEVLYAILVEGLGPLGSAFNRDDFSTREVQDTDGDGLMEFVDAWGEPLQFFRWPIYYGTVPGSSDSQLGSPQYIPGTFQYMNPSATRQQDPLDPNQLLVSPAWWSAAANPALFGASPIAVFTPPGGPSTNQCGSPAIGFMNYFHLLVDPTPGIGTGWDRGGGSNRRAFYSRFLILSSGPDKEPGVAQFNKDYSSLGGSASANFVTFPNSGFGMEKNARHLIYIENQAAQFDPDPRISGSGGSFFELPQSTATTVFLQINAAADDISNHNVSAPSTGVR